MEWENQPCDGDNNGQPTYRVLLYYQYVPISDPDVFVQEHLAFCRSLGLLGRVLVAEEGINGTVSGTVEATKTYMDAMHADRRFSKMEFKIDAVDGHVFRRLSVRVRPEIVNFQADVEINPHERTGKHLTPKEFYEALNDDDVVVIDGRNDYEYDIGHFRNAIRPPVGTFREFPQWIRENLSDRKDKKVITYCTGGIRCEKLTGFLLEEGFQDVSQLEGGIIKYGQDPEVKGKLFDGKCYVFDERIAVPVNREEDIVVGRCSHCGEPCDRYINCAYPRCHKQHLCCDACDTQMHGYCTTNCEIAHNEEQPIHARDNGIESQEVHTP